jgi:putative acetyltransferase
MSARIAPSLVLLSCATDARYAQLVALIRAYADTLDVDLAYQGFAHELAHLTEFYAAPRGGAYIALLQ